mmetsp:Transcript_45089/g.97957  ORF Transcript_45089/g.97957 Transcript_45089/m.97957 type:complete len:81 (-) Transcript_45089:1185-1427(-)
MALWNLLRVLKLHALRITSPKDMDVVLVGDHERRRLLRRLTTESQVRDAHGECGESGESGEFGEVEGSLSKPWDIECEPL